MHTENNNKDLAFKDEKPSACIRITVWNVQIGKMYWEQSIQHFLPSLMFMCSEFSIESLLNHFHYLCVGSLQLSETCL